MSGLRWTRKTTEKIAEQLTCLGIEVSPNTVARLLSEMGFSLKTNRKNIESGVKHPRSAPRPKEPAIPDHQAHAPSVRKCGSADHQRRRQEA